MNTPHVDLAMYDWCQAAEVLFLKTKAVRRFLTVVVAGSLWLAAAGTALATTSGALDASYSVFSNSSLAANNRQMLGQTFTAKAPGQLDQVSLPVAVSFAGWGDIYIVPVDSGGKPTSPFSSPNPSTAHYSGFVNCCTSLDFTIAP